MVDSVGLVLTGGGARAAFQAGVLKALVEITDEVGVEKPFTHLSGISAGAMNAAFLASRANDWQQATFDLVRLWENVHTEEVFKADMFTLVRIAARWLAELTSGGFIGKKQARALLDTTPLQSFIKRWITFPSITEHIEKGTIHSLDITALNYGDGSSHTFYQAKEPIPPWIRIRRYSEPATIAMEHILASTAIPMLFPPAKIGQWYFGDGSVRNHTPMSPAIKLGAKKLLVIGMRRDISEREQFLVPTPTVGRIASVLLNSIFLDALDLDYERIERINQTLAHVKKGAKTTLKQVEVLLIRPSEDIGQISLEEISKMPRSVRYLVRGLGTPAETTGITSHLLFEPSYTKRLVALGYHDTMDRKDDIIQFYTSP